MPCSLATVLLPAELRAEQLKRLATEAVPVLVVHPIFESVLPYYEIDMAHRETAQSCNISIRSSDTPYLPRWRAGFATAIPSSDRSIKLRQNGRPPAQSSKEVLAHLSRDIELLAGVAGDIRRVSAIGPATLNDSFASLQVQMKSAAVSSLRWSVGSTAGVVGLQVTLLGERGAVTLRELAGSPTGTIQWQLETVSDDRKEEQLQEAFTPARFAIERLTTAIAERSSERRAATSTWEAATRDMEVVDAIELSLQKGRTMEVFQQQLTERLAFRGTMAAIGCGLLLLAFFAVVGVAMIGGTEGALRQRLAPAWPLLLLAVLAFFLLLQAVPMLAQKRRTNESEPPEPNSEEVR